MKRIFFLLCCSVLVSMAVVAVPDSTKPVVTDTSKGVIYVNDASTAEEQMLIEKESTGDPGFYMGRARFVPGANIPEHVHETSLETVYVLSGTGTMTIGKETYALGPGSAIYVPANTPHSFTNSGKDMVEVLHMYAPGGPEDRFKSWKKKAN